MHVVVFKEHLKEGLGITEHVAGKSLTMPILQNVLLSVKKGEVKLCATDLQMGITFTFQGTAKEEGEVVFPGRFLSALLAVSSGDHVSLATEGQNLSVAAGEHQAVLKTLDAEEFPIIPSLEGGEPYLEVETSTLCRGLNQVVGMTGQSQTRPEISGVLFVFAKKEVHVVATDSFRLAEKTFLLEKDGDVEQSFILPAKTARELITILGERPGKTVIHMSPSQAIFDYESQESPLKLHIQIVSRIIEGEYPRYEDVIPSSQKTTVVVSKNEFQNHLKAAGIFASKTQEVRLRVDPAKKEVTFSSENAEAGSHTATLRGEITGDPVEVAFNWRFLSEGLAHIRGERVEFGMNGEDGPALARSVDQEGYRYVIMPIKA